MKKLLLADVVTHNRRHLMAGFLFASGLAISATALAVPINVDFGLKGHVITSTTFGAASGQTGNWNNITAFSTPSGIVDIGGNATSVAITVTAGTMGGIFPLPTGDANALMEDNFFSSSGASWTISITGLSGTLFDIYLYEPHHGAVGTGSGTVEGIAFSNINGNFSLGTFVLDSNYHLLSGVTITGGTLTATGSQPGTHSGIAGIQVVPLAAVPEPGTLGLLTAGLLGLAFARRSKTA